MCTVYLFVAVSRTSWWCTQHQRESTTQSAPSRSCAPRADAHNSTPIFLCHSTFTVSGRTLQSRSQDLGVGAFEGRSVWTGVPSPSEEGLSPPQSSLKGGFLIPRKTNLDFCAKMHVFHAFLALFWLTKLAEYIHSGLLWDACFPTAMAVAVALVWSSRTLLPSVWDLGMKKLVTFFRRRRLWLLKISILCVILHKVRDFCQSFVFQRKIYR